MPKRSRASSSWRLRSSQIANANMPRRRSTQRAPSLLVEVDDRLGVAVGRKTWPRALEVAPQLAVVVDLAVEDDPDGAVLVGDRLMAAFEVDDAEPAHRQANGRRLGDPGA